MEDELKAEEAIDSIIDSLGDVMIGFSEKTEEMKLFANTAGRTIYLLYTINIYNLFQFKVRTYWICFKKLRKH